MKITLKNTKQIKRIEFDLPSKPGVYVFCGTNGIGKTTIFHAISFLFNKGALRSAFRPGSNGYDSFFNATITYTEQSESVTYKFNSANWAPSTKKSAITSHHPYKKGTFLKVDHTRVVPKDDVLKSSTPVLCDFAMDVKNVVGNPIFEKLSTVTIQGKRKAFVCNNHTEKYFSSGELAVTKIISSIYNKRNMCILIDEAEISLHPDTQLRLLNYLNEIATQNELIILISSHSQVIIKYHPAKDIFFIEPDSKGGLQITNPCFPSYALQSISPIKDYFSDRIFLFEDEEAIIFFEELVKKKSDLIKKKMSYICLPVAGWAQLAKFLDNANKHLCKSPNQKYKAIFDADVNISDLKVLPFHSSIAGDYDLLEITPEITPIRWLTHDKEALDLVNSALCRSIAVNMLPSLSRLTPTAKSKEIKFIWNEFIKEYSLHTAVPEVEVKRAVYSQWIGKNSNDINTRKLFGLIF